MEVVIACGTLVVVAAICAGTIWHLDRTDRTDVRPVVEAVQAVATELRATRPVVPARRVVTRVLLDVDGQEWVREAIDSRRRGPSWSVRVPDGRLIVAQAMRQRADGVWEYRMVGVERER